MKKILALALTLALVLSMCITASAEIFANPVAKPDEITVKGMNGDTAAWYTDLVLTDEEIAQVREKNLTLAYEMPNESEFSAAVLAGLEAACEELNIEIKGLAVCENDPAVQKENMENFLSLGVDYVAAQAQEVDMAAPSFDPLRDAGVKLIFQGNFPTGYKAGVDCLSIQAEDYASYGVILAHELAKQLDYKGKVGAIVMSAVNQVANSRDNAFVEVMGEYEGIEVVEVGGIEQVSDAGTVASAMLTRHPDLDGLYVTFVEPATEALEVIRGLGMKDLKLVTNDFNSMAVLDMLQDGNVTAFAVDRPAVIGEMFAVIAAYDALGKEYIASSYLDPVALALPENLEIEWVGGFKTELPAEIKTALEAKLG